MRHNSQPIYSINTLILNDKFAIYCNGICTYSETVFTNGDLIGDNRNIFITHGEVNYRPTNTRTVVEFNGGKISLVSMMFNSKTLINLGCRYNSKRPWVTISGG